MSTTKLDLRQWFAEGVEAGSTHMIVVCDTFDWDDYPVYVMPGEDVHEREKYYRSSSMQKVMEVYNLQQPMEPQMRPGMVFNY